MVYIWRDVRSECTFLSNFLPLVAWSLIWCHFLTRLRLASHSPFPEIYTFGLPSHRKSWMNNPFQRGAKDSKLPHCAWSDTESTWRYAALHTGEFYDNGIDVVSFHIGSILDLARCSFVFLSSFAQPYGWCIPYTVNVTGESLVLNNNFPSIKQGFSQH